MKNKFKIENNIFSIHSLNIATDAIVQGVDGSIFCAYKGILYKRKCSEKDFVKCCYIDESKDCNILAFDNQGNLYYAGTSGGKLYISRDYGCTFTVCLKDSGNKSFRGFAIDRDGTIYTGSYAPEGPASLYRSDDDGKSWFSIHTFRTRHIHTVAVNPYTNWLYIVCGERKGAHSLDAYKIFRSKDKGETCYPIVEPMCLTPTGKLRPLYLSIGFSGNQISLGTDHQEGNNGIDSFTDTGEDKKFFPERVLTCPKISFANGVGSGYCWKITSWNDILYTFCVGDNISILYSSIDGINWNKSASFSTAVGRNAEFYPFNDKLYINGVDDSYYISKDMLSESLNINWDVQLLNYDSRFDDFFCSGYYLRSLQNSEKRNLVFDILHEYKIHKDATIADVGCGVGPMLLAGRIRGFLNMVGIEANPRWIIAARHLYEASFSESPNLCLVQRGDFTLPLFFKEKLYDVVLILGVFVGNGNAVPFEKGLRVSYEKLNAGGILVFDLDPKTYGKEDIGYFLYLVAKNGYQNIRCHHFREIFTVSCSKSLVK